MPDDRITAVQRRAVFERAQYRCEYCRTPEACVSDPFAVEHIIPRSKGGKTRLNNLACACTACNGHKHKAIAAVDPFSRQLVPLFHPRKQRWAGHFSWSEDGLRMVGLTPTGRATVKTLQMNHPKMIKLRQLLLLAGAHPLNEQELN